MAIFEIDKLAKNVKIHFIGIGGVSMSALAVILKNDGFCVSGSDFKESAATKKLCEMGIDVKIGHKEENIEKGDCVVYTAAIREDNPELIRAREIAGAVIDRATLLGAVMKRYKEAVCVSGTHGKTTTTSMLAEVFLAAKLDPTVLVGGNLSSIGGNMRDGSRDLIVTESCEYCGSFLKFFPTIAIILNIEEDHLDYFKDLEDIKNCFKSFAGLVPKSGFIIANFDDKDVVDATISSYAPVISYGIRNKDAQYTAENILYNESGCASFDVYCNYEKIADISLSVTGEHNVSNALAVFATSKALGIDTKSIREGILNFSGTDRRFQKRGTFGDVPVIDDYAHHPTEIKATLKAAKNASSGKIWAVFQPHTYTRAFKLLDEFSESFYDADNVIVTDIYAAREKDTGLINSMVVTEAISKKSKNAVYIKDFEDIAKHLKENVRSGDIILTLGAGNVCDICKLLVE